MNTQKQDTKEINYFQTVCDNKTKFTMFLDEAKKDTSPFINFVFIEFETESAYRLFSYYQKIAIEFTSKKFNLTEEEKFALIFAEIKLQALDLLKECSANCLADNLHMSQAMSVFKILPFLDKIYSFILVQVLMRFNAFTMPQNGE
jgi:hypothetical protein